MDRLRSFNGGFEGFVVGEVVMEKTAVELTTAVIYSWLGYLP